MSPTRTLPPFNGHTFLGLPLCTDLEALQADFAILGIPVGCPYPGDVFPNDQWHAPTAIRRESARLSLGLDRWDFDIERALSGLGAVDCGDAAVPAGAQGGGPAGAQGEVTAGVQALRPYDRWAVSMSEAAGPEQAVRAIVRCGAKPVILGGDHSVSIPALRAFAGHGSLTLVQVDAHLDWRDEVNGVRDGYSSPMRRAAEMAHIERIVQIGLRAQGSARQAELQAAQAYGAELITAYTVHEQGMPAILARIPSGRRYYLTIDADGLDPSVMPGVEGPAAGGLFFHQVRAMIHGLARKGELAGMDIVEIAPARDLNGISALTAGQLVINFLGAA